MPAEPEARRPIGYLPENHRFPTYFTGAGMLDFYAALSGVDAARRKKLIPEQLELVGLEPMGHHADRQIFQGHAAAPGAGASADSFAHHSDSGRTHRWRRSGGPPPDPRDSGPLRRARRHHLRQLAFARGSGNAVPRSRHPAQRKSGALRKNAGSHGRQRLPANRGAASRGSGRRTARPRDVHGAARRLGRLPISQPRTGQRRRGSAARRSIAKSRRWRPPPARWKRCSCGRWRSNGIPWP